MNQSIEEKILKYAKSHKPFKVSELVKEFRNEYTRQYLSSKVQTLVQTGDLIKSGIGINTRYTHENKKELFQDIFERRYRNNNLSEEDILNSIRSESFFKDELNEDIQCILEYALSEMINNAIEHSQSGSIYVKVLNDGNRTSFIVRDYGIGIYRNVQQKFNLETIHDAINEILKGKVTTQPHAHSGEGIFFTSKVADRYHISSQNTKLTIDNILPDIFVEEIPENVEGTEIFFEISNTSKKHLNTIFREYQSDPDTYAFDKTKITVKLYTLGSIYISRSQARRVLSNLDKFDHIILDFKDVPTVGQAFADEIFRVYKSKRPEVVIEAINTNRDIDFMIGRV